MKTGKYADLAVMLLVVSVGTTTCWAQKPPLEQQSKEEMLQAIARQQAIVDQKIEKWDERPRKTFISGRTQEYRLAQYAEDWRQKVQYIGTLNYPSGPDSRLYGTLTASVEIHSDGTLAKAEISKSSGNKMLDAAALRIIELAAPFEPFPPNIKVDTDTIVIGRTFTFARDKEEKSASTPEAGQ